MSIGAGLQYLIQPLVNLTGMASLSNIIQSTDRLIQRIDGHAQHFLNGVQTEADRTRRRINELNSGINKQSQLWKTAAAALGGYISVSAGYRTLQLGVSEAANMEVQRQTLDTMLKSPEKGADMMKWSTNFANVTPYETGEVVDASVKLSAYGLDPKKTLGAIGDMTAGMGKSLNQGIEAIADAQTGELERLKEFSITKKMLIEKANAMFKGQEVVNSKGQIVNQELLNKALFAIMEERFKGGMEKQSKTMKGLWSTVTGVTKTGLAEIIGITSEGTIRQGSLFEFLKDKVTTIGEKLTTMASDGTFTRWGEVLTDTVDKTINFLIGAKKFYEDHELLIKGIVLAYVSWQFATKALIFWEGVLKATLIAGNIYKEIAFAVGLLAAGESAASVASYLWATANGTLMVSMGLLTISIAAIIWAGYTLYKRWDDVKQIFVSVSDTVVTLWDIFMSNPVTKMLVMWNPVMVLFRSVYGLIIKIIDAYNYITGSNINVRPEAGSIADMALYGRTSEESFIAGQSPELQNAMNNGAIGKTIGTNQQKQNVYVNIPVKGTVDKQLISDIDAKVNEAIANNNKYQLSKTGVDMKNFNYSSVGGM